MAAPSAACADGTVEITSPLGNGAVKDAKLNVTARRADAAALPTRSKISGLTFLDTVRSSKRSHFWALSEVAVLLLTRVVLDGANDQQSVVGAKDTKASKQYFIISIAPLLVDCELIEKSGLQGTCCNCERGKRNKAQKT